MEIQGKIIKKFPLRSGVSQSSGNGWKVQEYLLETHEQYPRKVLFNLFGDKADQFTANVGDEKLVSFDIESRSYTGRDGVERWSTDIRAWKMEDSTSPAQPANPEPKDKHDFRPSAQAKEKKEQPKVVEPAPATDELPF